MATRNSSLNGVLNDYSQLRAVPALLGMLFAVAGLYQFGAFSTMEFAWFDYTIETTHMMFASLAIFALAFMSSETKNFEHYAEWEQGAIAAVPILILGYEYVGFVQTLVNTGEPYGQILAFLVTVAGYGVAMR